MPVVLFCAVMAVLWLWPRTPAGRFLRRWLIEAPARRLRLAWIVFGLAVLAIILTALTVAKAEGLIVVAQSAEAVAWFAAFDVATWIDVLAAAWLLAATVRLRAVREATASAVLRVRQAAASWIAALRAGARTPGPRRRNRRRKPPADDGRGWAGAAFA